MNTIILVVFTVVAAGSSGRLYEDWRPIGEFRTEQACQAAAASMNVLNRYRCLNTGSNPPR